MQTNNFVQIQECIDKLISKMKPITSTKVKTAIVALYSADQHQQLKYSSQIALLNLDYDRQIKAYLLRLYDLETIELLLEMELYYGFADSYRKIETAENMYVFQVGENGVIGIQYRNQQEAELFQLKLKQVAPKMSQFHALKKRLQQQKDQQRKQNSFFGKLKKRFYGKHEQKLQIRQSIVLQMSKQNTVKLDGQGGLIFDVLPPEWQQIIAQAGLKISDLQDKEIANIVCQQTIIYQLNKECLNLHLEDEVSHCTSKQNNQNLPKERNQSPNHHKEKQKAKIQEKQLGSHNNHPSFLQILNLPPPQLSTNVNNPNPNITRQNLLQQIRNNKIKLKPITPCQDGLLIDASSMNKQQINDLGDLIRSRLLVRKMALNRRKLEEDD